MSKALTSSFYLAAILALLITSAGCVWIFREVDVRQVNPVSDSVVVESRVRVHFVSGRNAVFAGGAVVEPHQISALGGSASVYDVDLAPLPSVERVSMDSVAAVETYSDRHNVGASVSTSILATAGTALGVPLLMVAIFGSCPTVYSFENGEPVLDGESFSNSIVSLFEKRDVDRLRARATAAGFVELEIRNEALETHYINHLELIEVQHPPTAIALPAPDGLAYLLETFHTPTSAVDRAARDVLGLLAAADGADFSTDPALLAAANPDDLTDYIDLTFSAPESDSAVVVLKLRNSLLNTVYFYDFMLAGQGARSLDWMGRDLKSISYAIELGDFYARHMGLRVQVRQGTTYREVGRVSEVGPIAWDHVAVPVPATGSDSLHIRLHFIADAWRIDEVSLATDVRTAQPRRVPPASITSSSMMGPSNPLEVTAKPDDAYLVTMPGTRFHAKFDVGDEPETGARTFFLAAQGYYTEWIRRDWLARPSRSTFTPSANSLHAAMQRWQEVKPTFEADFESFKVPVQ